MDKIEIIEEIHRLENLIGDAQQERDRLKAVLHEIECDERNERIQAFAQKIEVEGFTGQPILPENWTCAQFDEVSEYLDAVAEVYGLKRCIYSCHDKNLGDVAIEGPCFIKHTGWDDEKHVESFDSPTWLDVWKFADRAIALVDDGHHVFLEGVYKPSYEKSEDTYHLSMGS